MEPTTWASTILQEWICWDITGWWNREDSIPCWALCIRSFSQVSCAASGGSILFFIPQWWALPRACLNNQEIFWRQCVEHASEIVSVQCKNCPFSSFFMFRLNTYSFLPTGISHILSVQGTVGDFIPKCVDGWSKITEMNTLFISWVWFSVVIYFSEYSGCWFPTTSSISLSWCPLPCVMNCNICPLSSPSSPPTYNCFQSQEERRILLDSSWPKQFMNLGPFQKIVSVGKKKKFWNV